ncbi:hypothetical protein B0H10DRAFT_1957867 [Mycena sp. CBHHK59/15]|nr:hypothetical protein B0H10DRAFT_1957867 [Mycena sp. CBHHK59/15]
MASSSLALFVLRVLSPALVCLSAVSLLPASPPPPASPSPITRVVVSTVVPRRALILCLLSLFALTFLLDGLIFVVYAVIDKTWPQESGIEFNAVIGLVAFAGLAALGAWKDIRGVDVWSMKRIKLSVATASALDLAIVILMAKSVQFNGGSRFPITHTSIGILFPSLRALTGPILVAALSSPRIVYKTTAGDADEDAPATDTSFLLPPPSTGLSPSTALPSDASKYGTFRTPRSVLAQSNPATRVSSPIRPDVTDPKANAKSEISLDPSWSEMWRRTSRLAPYLWPSKSRPLQLLCLFCIILVLLGRVVNASIPFALGELIRIFEGGSSRSLWPVLFVYVILRFLQGSGGLAALRDLSFSFHTHRKTGEILRVLDRGAAINHTLEHILFTIIPTFIDIAVALVVFCIKFEWALALVVFFVMFAYVAASVIITRWRTKIRRQMNERDVVTRGIHTDCLLNYETVKYFGGEEHEGERYRAAVNQYQELEYKVIISLNLLNLVQNFIISIGLLVGSMIVALRVTRGQSAPSDFVIFITYLAQLYGPLNQLGYIYRSINQSLVDTEKLLKLLNEPTEVNDRDNAAALVVEAGAIEFDNVSFSYDKRTTALNGVSFKVPKGCSVALVGESGAGKSTILRLLYRFYDLQEGGGRILIDGQDIRDVTQKSLRAAIGVVPQDSVLFNASIGYNIGYGKFGASPEEIEEAAKSAQMHDRIVTFPDGRFTLLPNFDCYETKVGERGVRLSGGEKQRVAIARTLLKNPPILLLDEATSALDTSTEKDIQKALQNLVKGRSSLSIAHRLSTIASADLILVLKDGQIVEQGSHTELLALDGIFASMWADQISTSGGLATPPAGGNDPLPEPDISGYSLEPAEHVLPGAEAEVMPETMAEIEGVLLATEPPLVDTLEAVTQSPEAEDEVPIELPGESEPKGPEEPSPVAPSPSEDAAPIVFPATETADFPSVSPTSPLATAPLTFPVSADEEPQEAEKPTPIQTPGVTFEPGLTSPTSAPDPDAEPKRKRISSQNFQRLARRISLTTRRQGSTSSMASIIPGLKKSSGDDSSVPDKGKGKKKEKEKKRKSSV